MDRRHFLSALAAGALAAPLRSLAAEAAERECALFTSNPQLTPLRGFAGQDIACDALAIEGSIPAALRGTFYRNGPGLFERGGQRYRHPFDGDGLVHAYRFTDQGVSHRARFVRTAKFTAESRAGQFLVWGFGTPIKPRIPVTGPDSFNTANTNVLVHAGRLLALWEGGSAHELDPESLATIGPVTWRPELKQMPFSAHPKVEPDGTAWNFGAFGGRLAIYHIAPGGSLERHQVIPIGMSHFVHDFAVTERHLVFLLPPVELEMEALKRGAPMAESLRWHGDLPTRVLTIDKGDFSQRREYELPAFNFFHFGNAWEDAHGVIRADFVRNDDLGVMNWMPALMKECAPQPPRANPALLVVDPGTGRARVEVRDELCEFPRVDPRRVGRRYRNVFMPAHLRAANGYRGFDSVVRLDLESGTLARFTFDEGMAIEEHVVVPRPGSTRESDAWLIGAGFDTRRQQSFVTVLDAQDLESGPLAIARLPYWLPAGLHGTFRAA